MSDEATRLLQHRGLRKGLYVIPTAFTAANVAMGFLSVLWTIRGFQASAGDPSLAASYFNSAAMAIGLAILFDTVDGASPARPAPRPRLVCNSILSPTC